MAPTAGLTMGAWGVQLYQDDTALDVKAAFALMCRIPASPRELAMSVLRGFPAAADPSDLDYPVIWLALADQMHEHGLHDDEMYARALQIISGGLDEAVMQARDASAADIARRRIILHEIAERWKKPHHRPKRRKLLKAPEKHVFDPGTIVAYPTCGGEAANYADVSNRLGWFEDGWGSALILSTGHIEGWFAWTAAGRLSAHGAGKPDFDTARIAAIENQPWDMNPTGEGTLAVQIGALPPAHAKRMGFVSLGRIDLDPIAAARLRTDIETPQHGPLSTIHSVFTWWEPGVKPLRELRPDSISSPRGVVPIVSLCRGSSA